jgi:hypothetical protein
MLNNFLNILNLLKKECLVNRYEYTNADKESIQKKYTIEDDEYFYLGNKQNKFNKKDLPINKHNEIFKLKSSSVSNIFKLLKEEEDSKYDYKKFTDDRYKFHGEGSDRYYSMDSRQEWLKEVIGNRTLIELEPKTIHSIYQNAITIKKKYNNIMNCFKDERIKSVNFQKLYSILKQIDVLKNRLEEIKSKDINSDEHCDCYSHDDYFESMDTIKLSDDIKYKKDRELYKLEKQKTIDEKNYIEKRIAELKKEEHKIILETKKNKLYIDSYGEDTTYDDEEISIESLIKNYD